jgi:hypothetical protein
MWLRGKRNHPRRSPPHFRRPKLDYDRPRYARRNPPIQRNDPAPCNAGLCGGDRGHRRLFSRKRNFPENNQSRGICPRSVERLLFSVKEAGAPVVCAQDVRASRSLNPEAAWLRNDQRNHP